MSIDVRTTSAEVQASPDHYKRNPGSTVEALLPQPIVRWLPAGAVCRRGLAVCLLYVVAAIYFTWPIAPNFQTHTVAHIDPPFSAWRLAWVAHQLVRAPEALFDANIFWPARRTLAYSDAMLVEGVLALPLIRMGVSPLAVMNLFTLVGMAASAAGAYLLARRLSGHTGAAILAGMVFAFAPYRHDHLHHLELQWAQWMPLAFWAWHRTLDQGRFSDGLLCGVFVLLQLLSSIYYGIFLGTTMALLGVVTLVHRRFRVTPQAVAGLVVGAVILAIGAAEYSRPYGQAQQRVGNRNTRETRRYSANPASFLSTAPGNRVYGPMTGSWNDEEKRLFPGATPLVLAGVALAPPASATALVYGVVTLFTADAALGLNGFSFTQLRRYLPPFRGFRAPARFGVLVQLGLGVLAALGLARLARRWPHHATRLTIASVVLVTIEYSAKPASLMAMPTAVPRMYHWLAAALPPDTVVLELPVPRPDTLPFEDPTYMYASTWHWKPLVNGYSGHYYPPYVSLLHSLKTFPSDQSLAHMERNGVQVVILHKLMLPDEQYKKLVAKIEGNPKFQLLTVADDWVTEARAYAFLPRYRAKPASSDE